MGLAGLTARADEAPGGKGYPFKLPQIHSSGHSSKVVVNEEGSIVKLPEQHLPTLALSATDNASPPHRPVLPYENGELKPQPVQGSMSADIHVHQSDQPGPVKDAPLETATSMSTMEVSPGNIGIQQHNAEGVTNKAQEQQTSTADRQVEQILEAVSAEASHTGSLPTTVFTILDKSSLRSTSIPSLENRNDADHHTLEEEEEPVRNPEASTAELSSSSMHASAGHLPRQVQSALTEDKTSSDNAAKATKSGALLRKESLEKDDTSRVKEKTDEATGSKATQADQGLQSMIVDAQANLDRLSAMVSAEKARKEMERQLQIQKERAARMAARTNDQALTQNIDMMATAICEDRNWTQKQCFYIGCCQWAPTSAAANGAYTCLSAVGNSKCDTGSLITGYNMCTGHGFGKAACELIGCCAFNASQECDSAVGNNYCHVPSLVQDMQTIYQTSHPGNGDEADVNAMINQFKFQ